MLGHANVFLTPAMLTCRIATPPAKRTPAHLATFFRGYLPTAWANEDLPANLPPPAQRTYDATKALKRRVAPLMNDQYFRPLPPPKSADQWDAMQFHSRRRRGGVLLVFRQHSKTAQRTIGLRGLEATGLYRIRGTTGPASPVAPWRR